MEPKIGPKSGTYRAVAFRRTNRVLTLMWALVFALIAVLGYSPSRRRRPPVGPKR